MRGPFSFGATALVSLEPATRLLLYLTTLRSLRLPVSLSPSYSIVGQSLHCVFPAGHPRGVCCAEHGSGQRDQSRVENPLRRDQDRERGEFPEKPRTHEITQPDARRYAEDAKSRGF